MSAVVGGRPLRRVLALFRNARHAGRRARRAADVAPAGDVGLAHVGVRRGAHIERALPRRVAAETPAVSTSRHRA